MPTVTRPGEAEGDPPRPPCPVPAGQAQSRGCRGRAPRQGTVGTGVKPRSLKLTAHGLGRPGGQGHPQQLLFWGVPVAGQRERWGGESRNSTFLQPAAFLSTCPGPRMDKGLAGPLAARRAPRKTPVWLLGPPATSFPWAGGGGLTTLFRLVPLALLTGTPRCPRRPKHTGARAPRDGTSGSSGPHQQAVLGLPSLAPGSCRAPPSLRPWVPLGADPAVALPSQQRRVAARSVALVSGRCCPCVGRAREQALRSAGRGRLYFG